MPRTTLSTKTTEPTQAFLKAPSTPKKTPNGGAFEWDVGDRVAELERQIDAVYQEGAIAPDGAWIETGQSTPKFRQAWYRSRSACFTRKRGGGACKSCYLGAVGSHAHLMAKAAIDRRNKVQELKAQIKKLEGR